MRRKEILKILLSVLIAIFIMVGAAALLLAGFRRSAEEEQKKTGRDVCSGKRTYRSSHRRCVGDSLAQPYAAAHGDADSYSHNRGRL